MTQIFTVVTCGQVQQVPSQKAEGGFLSKRVMLMQEYGTKYGDQYLVSQFGNGCQQHIDEGDVVLASLRLSAREYQGQMYQDIVVNDIKKLSC